MISKSLSGSTVSNCLIIISLLLNINTNAYSQNTCERIYVSDNYIDVIEKTFNKQNYFKPVLERHLLSIAKNTIDNNFNKKGANNSSSYKYEIFRDRFPVYISLSDCGVMDEKPNELVKEKRELFPPYLKAGLIYFLSTKPYSEKQRAELRTILGDLKCMYAEKVRSIFPDFEIIAGSDVLSRIIDDHVDDNIADQFENYFSFRTLHITKEDIAKQLGGELPSISTNIPNYKNGILKQINDPSVNKKVRLSLKQGYISAVKSHIHSIIDEWIENLYLFEKHGHADYRDEVLFRANNTYVGLSKNDILRIQKSYTKYWNDFMKACKKIHNNSTNMPKK